MPKLRARVAFVLILATWLAAGALTAKPERAVAIPVFAHRYGFRCQVCHTVVPRLNEFGDAFLANGYQLPGLSARGTIPLAVKVNLVYASTPDPGGLPKAIVDEIELLSGGSLAKNVAYFAEAYVVDGGRLGAVRDLWASYRLPAPIFGLPAKLVAGQFTLPVAVDPETFRETSSHYALFDQTVGANPFNFFDPKIGAQAIFGDEQHGPNFIIALLQGHDKQSGLPARGIDRMLSFQGDIGALVASVYRYDGERPLRPGADRFWRQGYGASYRAGRIDLDVVVGHGFDTNADGLGTAQRSSGGFIQGRYAFTPDFFGIVRYDGTNQRAAFERALVAGAGTRLSPNSRLLIEDRISHQQPSGHALTAALLFAY